MNRSIWRSRLGLAFRGASSGLLVWSCSSGESHDTPADEVPSSVATPAPAAPASSNTPATSSSRPPSAAPATSSDPGNSAAPGENTAPPAPAELCDGSLGFDEQFELMEEDVAAEDDAVFYRYVTLANRLNQGACAAELEHDRLALVKAVNSVSTETSIALPEPLGTDGALLRIDLRDLGWDQPVVVDGVAFTDKWEAIVAASEFAVEFEGDVADDVVLDTNTRVPLLSADALIDVALKGDLYYELLGIGATEDDLLAQLGIDEEAQEEEKVVIRAGTTQSRMSRQATVVERLELENRPGSLWSRYDLADAAGQDILVDPLGFQEDLIATIFTLPNGLNAYVMFDGAGQRIDETDILFDPNEADGGVENSVSCSSCHAAGLNPITDEVRAYAQANSRDFDADTLGEIEDSFLEQREIDTAVRNDSQIYLSALSRAGLEDLKVDPVSAVYVRFDSDVTLAVAAGDLGLTPDELRDEISLLSQVDPKFSVLRSGTFSRAVFEALYLPALCALTISNENQPSATACAEVGQ